MDQFANDHRCRDAVNFAQLMEWVDAPWLVQCYFNNSLHLVTHPSFTEDHNSLKYQTAHLFYEFVLTIME